jgi:exodeoxyribonuclease VII large subunit
MLAAMRQMALFGAQARVWKVSELSRFLRELIESAEPLQDLRVQGEISNFSRPTSGHWYFTLKDKEAELRCVMWRTEAQWQTFTPDGGLTVEVHGRLSVYEARGQYQLYVDEIRPAGEGELFREFLRVKEKLEKEGLFAVERKRPIPIWPKRIGIVTSPSGAAISDILNTIERRFPIVEVVLAPAAVQGPAAESELLRSLARLNRFAKPNVILVARGGGSLEDLAAFNSERLARAIAGSQAPVVCGIGHETDFTIADFAADLRAPTPTAAAELVTPDKKELLVTLRDLNVALARNVSSKLRESRHTFERRKQDLVRNSPLSLVENGWQRIDDLNQRGRRALQGRTRTFASGLGNLEAKLSALSPSEIVRRGFAVVETAAGGVVRSRRQAKPGERIEIRVSDGRFGAVVAKERDG